MTVTIFDPIEKIEYTYALEPRLKRYLDNKVKINLAKEDRDVVIIIDGYEGSGKSTFAMQVGKYVDPTLNLNRICMSSQEFKDAIIKSKKNTCVIYDEAVTGMTATESLTRVGKMLKSLMMQMRQKNLFVIIVMPNVFDFSRYAVLARARAFFHVYENKSKRGYFVGYNRKDLRLLYFKGKKTYSYRVKSVFTGRFYGKYVVDEALYRKKKEESMQNMGEEDEFKSKFHYQRNLLMYIALKVWGHSQQELITEFEKRGEDISQSNLSNITGRMGERVEKYH